MFFVFIVGIDICICHRRARGVDVETARQALVYSFGSEVVQKLSHEKLIERIQAAVKDTLASAGMA